MGELKVTSANNPIRYRRFVKALLRDYQALEKMLEAGMFEEGNSRIGAEQELCLIDHYWRPAPLSCEILADLKDPHYTTELARFNLEINLDPVEFTGGCFSSLETQLNSLLERLRRAARRYDADLILTGILPTIRTMDIELQNMTPAPRYKALFEALKRLRGSSFEYHIRGSDELTSRQEYPTFEFCNTSFQVHLQVPPERFVKAYNFAKLITAPVLAAATNSPLLMGKQLWHETRIALFQQAVDTRNIYHHLRQSSARVSFSKQWIRHSILEIFQEDISRFRALLCTASNPDSLKALARGEVPSLPALRVFNGTVYRWNRACFGISNGKPHLRIENRVLPAGPTVKDEMANTAFWTGLMNGFPRKYERLPEVMDFGHAVSNFIKAARIGLDAKFEWLHGKTISAEELILKELLPIAQHGLDRAAVHRAEAGELLEIIEARVKSRKTGALWILNNFRKLKAESSAEEAIVAITAGMMHRQKKGMPVHKWNSPKLSEAGNWVSKYWRVAQIMSTDLLTVQGDDLLELVINIMDWKHIRHLPVVDARDNLVGLITSGTVLKHCNSPSARRRKMLTASQIMIKKPICVTPETLTIDAIAMMRKADVGSLPVVKAKKLVGIVTEHDFMQVCAHLLKDFYQTEAGAGNPAAE